MAKRATRRKPAETQQVEAAEFPYIARDLWPLARELAPLLADPENCRTHDESNLKAIRASLRRYGQRKPIVVNRLNGIIEAGNGTALAAQAEGWSHIAAVFVEDDPTTATGYAIADNRTAELAGWNEEQLVASLKAISTRCASVPSGTSSRSRSRSRTAAGTGPCRRRFLWASSAGDVST
ncbi:MAG: ParB N-terminal domain-containing protein [Planctomycetaceae bacterium]